MLQTIVLSRPNPTGGGAELVMRVEGFAFRQATTVVGSVS